MITLRIERGNLGASKHDESTESRSLGVGGVGDQMPQETRNKRRRRMERVAEGDGSKRFTIEGL